MERISLPKTHRTRRRDLPVPQYHPFLKWGAQGENIPKVIPRFTVWPSAYLAAKGVGNRRNNKFEDPYRWWGTTVSYILARVEYMGHTVNFKTCYRDSTASRLPKRIGKSLRTPTKPSLTRLHGKPRRSSAGRSDTGQTAFQYHLQRRIWRWPRGFSRRDRVSDESRITERTPRTVRLQDAWCGVFCVFGRVSCKFEFDGIFLYESGKHWFSLPDFKFVLPENPCKSGSFAKCLQFHLKNRLDNIHRT